MNSAGFGIVEDKKVQEERQRRSIPELKQGPSKGNEKKDFLWYGSGRVSGTGFRFDNLFGVSVCLFGGRC